MISHIKHLKTLLIHKWYVFLECCKLGIPLRGITHDFSKFTSREWKPYVLNFHSGWDRSNKPQWVITMFAVAWNHHQKRNPHHPEYWILMSRGLPDVVLPMLDKYRREMLADWRGAGRAYTGDSDVTSWYLKNRDDMRLHPSTQAWIEEQLGI